MAAGASTAQVAWASVDPVRRKLDVYPKAIAARIEEKFQNRDLLVSTQCVLGSDFFNATVHFHPSGSCYQTTPGMSMGRAGFKQPGYRSVKRVVKTEGMAQMVVYAKQVHGEWRIAATEADSEMTMTAAFTPDCLTDGSPDNAPVENFHPWSGNDLTSNAWDVSVVMWQWCRGVPEVHGNLMALKDEWWCPYLPAENSALEAGFKEGRDWVEFDVEDSESVKRTLKVLLTTGSSFALQRDEARGKERQVRRVVKTVQEVKACLDRIAAPLLDASDLSESENPNKYVVPYHFFCPITQDVMHDPVQTSDSMNYDRPAIERWLLTNNTSPLTNIPLQHKRLTANAALREEIETFIKTHEAHITPKSTPQTTPQNSSMNLLAAAGQSSDAAGAAAAITDAMANTSVTPP